MIHCTLMGAALGSARTTVPSHLSPWAQVQGPCRGTPMEGLLLGLQCQKKLRLRGSEAFPQHKTVALREKVIRSSASSIFQ